MRPGRWLGRVQMNKDESAYEVDGQTYDSAYQGEKRKVSAIHFSFKARLVSRIWLDSGGCE